MCYGGEACFQTKPLDVVTLPLALDVVTLPLALDVVTLPLALDVVTLPLAACTLHGSTGFRPRVPHGAGVEAASG